MTIYTNIQDCLSDTTREAARINDQLYIIRYGYHYETLDLWALQAEGKTPDITVFPDGHTYKAGQLIH